MKKEPVKVSKTCYQFEVKVFFWAKSVTAAKAYLNAMEKDNNQFWVIPTFKRL